MQFYTRLLFRASSVSLPVLVLILTISITNGQTSPSPSPQEEVATAVNKSPSTAAAKVPIYKEYRGVIIGMPAAEVRSKLEGLKTGKRQDYLFLSEQESAQIYYDSAGKVTAISIDYFDTSKAPAPDVVLGVALQAKPDGSMYQLNRYPEQGYWVSYNRTAGDKPIVTVTMQKM